MRSSNIWVATINISAGLGSRLLAAASPFVEAALHDLNRESSVMTGFAFGHIFQPQNAESVETSDSEIRDDLAEPVTAISPFERVIISVTPTSRMVFPISLELAGLAATLDRPTAGRKTLLRKAHPDLQWQVIGNHHYGESMADLKLTLHRPCSELIHGGARWNRIPGPKIRSL